MSKSTLAEFYDRRYAPSSASRVRAIPDVLRPGNRFEMAAKVARREAGGNYLEIGAGDGRLPLTVLDLYDSLVLTELSSPRSRRMRELFKDNPKVSVLDNDIEADGLGSFAEATFDTICLIAVVEHLIEPVRVLRKLHRVLKPGGRLIVDTPNLAKWTRRIKLRFGRFPGTSSFDEGLLRYDRKTPTEFYDEGHLHYFTFRSLARLGIERAGFTRCQKLGYGRTCLSRLWPGLFSEVFLVFYK